MHPEADTLTELGSPAFAGKSNPKHFALSVMVGCSITLFLFLGLAHFQSRPTTGPDEVESIAMSVMNTEPPPAPPPAPELTEATDASPAVGFELAHSDSGVKLAASPAFLAPSPEILSQALPPHADIAPAPRGLISARPADPKHVFQKNEVDQRPYVLDRGNINVPSNIQAGASELSAIFLIIVDADGHVSSARLFKTSGNAKFDALWTERIRNWTFSPAIKHGRKVRCLTQQPVTVQWRSGSPLSP